MDPQTGRCAILFPHGVLFRKEEARMRRKLIEADLVECVLGLGPNLFYNSPMEACVVVCRSQKPPVQQGKVLFINGVNEITRERAVSYLREENQQKIWSVYRDFVDQDGFSKVATKAEMAAQDYSLSIALYVKLPTSGKVGNLGRTLPELWAEWEEEGGAFWQEMDDLVVMLDSLSKEGN